MSERFPRCAPIWGLPADFGAEQLPRAYNSSMDSSVYAIVPADATDLPTPVSRFYLGTTGDVKLKTEDGQTITLRNLAAGVTHTWPFTITRIFQTGTTAGQIVGIF